MLVPGRIPMNDAENAAVEKLQSEHPDEPVSLTRRDPGESGPLLVHVGAMMWEVADDGKRKKVL